MLYRANDTGRAAVVTTYENPRTIDKELNMFVAFLFIPVVAGNVFMEGNIRNVPEITERESTSTKTYTIFDPCNTNKPGNRTRNCSQKKRRDRSESGECETYIRNDPVNVTCDMTSDGGGWTVIQRRSENEQGDNFFERNFTEYERGFGTPGESFWIGLENLHALTSFPNNQQALRIELKRSDGRRDTIVVRYNKFHVASAKESYKLTIDEYDGPKGKKYDSLSGHNRSVFTIKESSKANPDRGSCFTEKELLSGGWWFKDCNRANLNGRKFGLSTLKKPGITWMIDGEADSYSYIYHKVEMQIRDADYGFCTGSQKS
ncbi:ficolin-1-like [Ixodes scapularis]|uniref:ficolin-1-like n=1 Tax=Ixodes scapularis TaxID=6945 RepID=UPI001A9D004D|nr:ficolin-1-like [Ixodes scapularis]